MVCILLNEEYLECRSCEISRNRNSPVKWSLLCNKLRKKCFFIRTIGLALEWKKKPKIFFCNALETSQTLYRRVGNMQRRPLHRRKLVFSNIPSFLTAPVYSVVEHRKTIWENSTSVSNKMIKGEREREKCGRIWHISLHVSISSDVISKVLVLNNSATISM